MQRSSPEQQFFTVPQLLKRRISVIAVNAGHGTKGRNFRKDPVPSGWNTKVTGGTTGAGATSAVAVSTGMTFSDGTPESKVTLAMAKVFKDKLWQQVMMC